MKQPFIFTLVSLLYTKSKRNLGKHRNDEGFGLLSRALFMNSTGQELNNLVVVRFVDLVLP